MCRAAARAVMNRDFTTVVNGTNPPSHLRVKNGDRFEQIDFRLRPNFHNWGWGWNQVALQAHDGEWWFQNESGLFRFPRRKRLRN